MDKRVASILLVDDDEDDYVLTRDLLAELGEPGFELEWVSTYEAGLAAIEKKKHDVYLFDYRLGERNGLELLQRAIALGIAVPIILLTSQGDVQVDIAAMETGASDYLNKSTLSAELLERSIRYALERARAEGALRESEKRFRSLSENAPDIIYTLGVGGSFTYVNPAWEEIMGYGKDETLGKHFADFMKKKDSGEYVNLFKGIRNGKKIIRDGTITLLNKDGSPRLFNLSGAPDLTPAGEVTGMVGVLKDITEQRQTEAQLQQAQKMEAIGTLAGGIAHDFNNILTAILGHTDIANLSLSFLLTACFSRSFIPMPLIMNNLSLKSQPVTPIDQTPLSKSIYRSSVYTNINLPPAHLLN
jgi:two-component system cell cycle sensor histidine kinase/response regulator CckA